jgi:hypothetical protein
VTHESTKADGPRFRNAEILTLTGEKISRVEAYLGWDLG